MARNSKIGWTDDTHNFWDGCKKVSKGCKFCYMYRLKHRFNKDGSIITRKPDDKFYEPLKWKRPSKIFTCSMSDFFIKEADGWRSDAWKVIKDTPQHTWIILTKRPERILQHLPADWGKGYPNVWLLVSVEDQKTMALRVPKLFEVPCAVRGISIEPLLGPVDVKPYLNVSVPGEHGPQWVYPIHWVIVGGESGNDNGEYTHRPCKIEWIHAITAACQDKEVPVFVKQLGTHLYHELGLEDRSADNMEDPKWPVIIRKQEFPLVDV